MSVETLEQSLEEAKKVLVRLTPTFMLTPPLTPPLMLEIDINVHAHTATDATADASC